MQTKTSDLLLPVISCTGVIPSIPVSSILVLCRKQRTQKSLCVVIYSDYKRNPSSQLAFSLHTPASPKPHTWEQQVWKTSVLALLKVKIQSRTVTPLPCIHESILQTKKMISSKTVLLQVSGPFIWPSDHRNFTEGSKRQAKVRAGKK